MLSFSVMPESYRTPEQVMADARLARTCADALRETAYAVVPREPTDKMVEAMEPLAPRHSRSLRNMWRAAVAANEEGE
jgi:hypothetical protein